MPLLVFGDLGRRCWNSSGVQNWRESFWKGRNKTSWLTLQLFFWLQIKKHLCPIYLATAPFDLCPATINICQGTQDPESGPAMLQVVGLQVSVPAVYPDVAHDLVPTFLSHGSGAPGGKPTKFSLTVDSEMILSLGSSPSQLQLTTGVVGLGIPWETYPCILQRSWNGLVSI